MSGISPAPGPGQPSPLSDGEWHRMHPMTPLFRGGFVLVIVAGIVINNLRDQLAEMFVPLFVPGADVDLSGGADDLVSTIADRGLLGIVSVGVLVVILLLIGIFYLFWRFHTFRITEDDVEVRSGVLFRTHRRAPLDRVQGVNLTRPMIARLLGMAKLEVVGAGTDGNVKLEYLSIKNSETVRADILKLASGQQLEQSAAVRPGTEDHPDGRLREAGANFTSGVNEIIAGAELDSTVEPESVVRIPLGRLIASRVLSDNTVGLLVVAIAIIVGGFVGTRWLLISLIPLVFVGITVWVRGVTQNLRYSIAPTSSGLRVTFGLFTTITENLPPGRIHAVQITQPVLWRPGKWWIVTVNRLTGRSANSGDSSVDRFATVLPVGTRDDVQRVLRLMLPQVPEHVWPYIFGHGALGPDGDDPFTTTPRRGRWLRPFSWRRNGYLLLPDLLLMRRGRFSRKLAIFPLARMQSLAISQGPLDRALAVANLRAHTVAGRVSGFLGILDRGDALAAFEATAWAAQNAAASDCSHRWAGFAQLGADQVPGSDGPPSEGPPPQ